MSIKDAIKIVLNVAAEQGCLHNLTNRKITDKVGLIRNIKYKHCLSGSLIKQEREKLFPSILMFVYGTLLKGFGNHRLMTKARGKFIEEDEISAEMFGSGSSFPHIKLVDNFQHTVKGEVYELSSMKLQIIDRLEGYNEWNDNSLFLRKTTTTKKGHKVFVYEGGKLLLRGGKKIESGSWNEHTKIRYKNQCYHFLLK